MAKSAKSKTKQATSLILFDVDYVPKEVVVKVSKPKIVEQKTYTKVGFGLHNPNFTLEQNTHIFREYISHGSKFNWPEILNEILKSFEK